MEDIQDVSADIVVADDGAQNESEAKASELGWVPKDKWDKDPDDWTPAKQFLKMKDLFSVTKDLRDKNKKLEGIVYKMNDQIGSITEKVRAEERKKLKDEQDKALQAGDFNAAFAAEKAMNKLEQVPTTPPASAQAVNEFVSRNSEWFEVNPAMTKFAKAYEDTLAKTDPSMSVEERLIETEAMVKSKFAKNFKTEEDSMEEDDTPKPRAKVAYSSQTARGATAKRHVFDNMAKHEQDEIDKICKDLERYHNVKISREDYAKQMQSSKFAQK